MKLNKILLQMLSTTLLFSPLELHSEIYSGENYGLTALTLDNNSIESCTPDLAPITKQITTSNIDIHGSLPFIRTYQTNLQPDYRADIKTPEALKIDRNFPLAYLENPGKIGLGWNHNYSYNLLVIGSSYILNLPNSSLPIRFSKQSDGTIRIVDSSNNPVPTNNEYSITDNNLTIIVKNNNMEITFKSISGSRGISQQFQATQLKYLDGSNIINMTYSPMSRSNSIIGYLLTSISDIRGNNLKITRNNMNGTDTSVLGIQLQGQINSVELLPNTINKQTATYTYDTQNITSLGTSKTYPRLIGATTTKDGTLNYSYNNYIHKEMFSDNNQTIKGVTIPILSLYKNNGQTIRNFEVTDQILSSYSDKNVDYSYVKYSNVGDDRDSMSIAPPHNINNPLGPAEIIKYDYITHYNSIDYTDYSSSYCLTHNNEKLADIFFSKDSRNIIKYTTKSGKTVDSSFDEKNRLKQRIDGSGHPLKRTITVTYDNLSNTPTVIKKDGLTQTNTINNLGQIIETVSTSDQTNSTSKKTTYTYFTNGLLSSIDGPLAGTTDKISYTYDDFGNKITESIVINGVNRTTQFVNFNSFGQPERIVHPNGLVNKYTYNSDGSLASETVGPGTTTSIITGKTTTYTYDNFKRLISIKKPNGEITSYTYDPQNRIIKTTLPDSTLVQQTYHRTGDISSTKITNSTGTSFIETSSTITPYGGFIEKIIMGTDPNKNYEKRTNITAGGKIKEISTATYNGKSSRYYDHFDAPYVIQDPIDSTIDYIVYDKYGNIIERKDFLGGGSKPYSYINGNILSKETNSDYGTKSYTYNEANQLLKFEYGARKCENTNIDSLGRIGKISCTSASATTPETLINSFDFKFDTTRFGRLDSVVSNDLKYGTNIEYIYDIYDRITKKTQTNNAITTWGGANNKLSVTYNYSPSDQLESLILPSGRVISYAYNSTKKNQLIDIKLDSLPLLRNITYNEGGQMTGWNWGAGAASYTWSYDPLKTGYLKKIINKNNSSTINYSMDYEFDLDSRITKTTQNNGLINNFSYDVRNRLLQESRFNGSTNIFNINYTYDDNDNRLSLTATGSHQQPQANVAYTYTGNKLATIAGVAVSHTSNAELIYGGFTPTYDYAGNRREDKTTGGTTTSPQYYMTYNHKNERTIRGYAANGSVWKTNAIQYVYDENSHLIGEYNADGTPLVEYIWLGEKPVAAIYGSGTTAKTYWIVSDVQNTPRRLIDAADSATTVWAWDSTAFGVGSPNVQTVKFNLRFPGQYYDEVTKQHYNHNRFYNPVLGRYVEPDPIGLEGGFNPYIYAKNSPVLYVDTTGENPIIIGAVVGFGTYIIPVIYNSGTEEGDFIDNFKRNWDTGAAVTSTIAGAVTSGTSAAILKSTGLAVNRSKHLFPEPSSFSYPASTYLGKVVSKLPVKTNILGFSIYPQKKVLDTTRTFTNIDGIAVKVASSVASSFANNTYENWSKENSSINQENIRFAQQDLNQNLYNIHIYQPTIPVLPTIYVNGYDIPPLDIDLNQR
ncbi:RHS repeat domain-containing protein [Acinetobacter sp. RW6]|uniref:RHS repeat domain-containing protein n=1 Tax=Acinetobacter sp. RW6 TaxID=3242680 RepID=UPI0035C268B5